MKRACLVLALIVVAGCSAGEQTAAADRAVGEFRRLMESRQFTAVYTSGSDELRKSLSEADVARLLASVIDRLGNVKTAEKNRWNVNFHPSGTFVTLQFRTAFEKGEGSERFVFRITGKEAALVSYNVRFPAQLLN